MSSVIIRIPTPLRSYTQGADEVRVHGGTVGEALRSLGVAHEGLLARVLSQEGKPRQFVNIFLGSQNIRSLQGLETPVAPGDILSIVPAVAGGLSQRHA